MEINNYTNSCRFCLKNSKDMLDLFTYILQPREISLVDFVRKITDLKVSEHREHNYVSRNAYKLIADFVVFQIVKGEYLPNNSCITCIDSINAAFAFTQICIVSDEILKKEETRREFRKIEQEALLDENDLNNEILSEDQFGEEAQDERISVKCEGVYPATYIKV